MSLACQRCWERPLLVLMWVESGEMTRPSRARYAGYRFPAEIISHAVWLYFRFPLGLRMVVDLKTHQRPLYMTNLLNLTHTTVRGSNGITG